MPQHMHEWKEIPKPDLKKHITQYNQIKSRNFRKGGKFPPTKFEFGKTDKYVHGKFNKEQAYHI